MSPMTVLQRIEVFNQGRDPTRLSLKYQAMARDAFSFLRGTCHLFYEDWPATSSLNKAPLAWICGDLHLENFGAYKGDNRLTYFDINDFDEAVLAPCTWELARFLTSLRVSAQSLGVDRDEGLRLSQVFLDAYCDELVQCKGRWIERATAKGMIKDLLTGLEKRSRADLLRERTVRRDGEIRLRVDGKRALPATPRERRRIRSLIETFASQQAQPEFFQVLDIARRVAGLGSLGLERYVILIEGRGGREGHYLLDLKHQPGSALSPYLTAVQPSWKSEADRVVSLQRRSQAVAPAFLATIRGRQRTYVLKELMPQQDRLCMQRWNGKLRRLEKVIDSMGSLVAWAHLRSSGRQGSAVADEWIRFGRRAYWRKPLLAYVESYSRKVFEDWQSFKAAGLDS